MSFYIVTSVIYLGYRIDAEGLYPVNEKTKAIQDAPEPKDATELKFYLGLLSYYSRFLPNMSSNLAPLNQLLHKQARWVWTDKERRAFEASKQLLVSSQTLAHFDPKLQIILAWDASAYGIGTVLSHRLSDDTEKPVGFASRTLSIAEKKYSQLEKEGLACIFGVSHFRSFLYGHHFSLVTDNKPFQSLLAGNKSVPVQTSSRIQRWALTLASFEYLLEFRSTAQHSNADALSRLPLPEASSEVPTPAELVLLIKHLEEMIITAKQIKSWIWQWPIRPWSRIHVDFTGPMQGKTFLILIDSHLHSMSVTMVTATIQQMRMIFSHFGLLETLVSDNKPQFSFIHFVD